MHTCQRALLLTLTGFFASSAHAIVIDGDLADWGVRKNVGAAGWTPNAGIQYTIEDQHTNFLDPGHGGQDYDAEALYATIADGKLYIALATGHDPNTVQNPAKNSYGAGDFAIDFGKDGSYELGINIHHATKTGKEGFGIEGGVYGAPTWALGLWDSQGNHAPGNADPLHPTYLTAGTLLGMAELVYTTTGEKGYGDWPGHRHYFYEMSLDLALLGAAGWDGHSGFNIHWTENCANDSIIVAPPGVAPQPGSVPEPGTLALLPLGLAGLLGLRRRGSV